MLTNIWNKIKTWADDLWKGILSWTKNSSTILWARLQGVIGLIVVAASAVDWSSIARLDWEHDKTSLLIGLGLMANAVLTEVARRRTL